MSRRAAAPADPAPVTPTAGSRASDAGNSGCSRAAPALVLIVAALLGMAVHPVDLAEYARYAAAALRHPGQAWPREYPPLSLAVMLLPRLLPLPYPVAFTALAAAAWLAAATAWPVPAQRRWAWLAGLGSLALLTARYDWAPALATAAGVAAGSRQQWTRAWVWLVVGAALKGYAVALFPLLGIAQASVTGGRRAGLAALGATLAVACLWGLAGPPGAAQWVAWLTHRPPQVGSWLAALAALTGGHAAWAYGATSLVGGWAPHGLGLAAGIPLWGLTAGRLARRRVSFAAAAPAAVAAVILASPVFSAQYLIWLLPLWATAPLTPARLAVAAITGLRYPWLYFRPLAAALGAPHGPAVALLLPLAVVRAACLAGDVLRPAAGAAVPPAD